ncbi:transglutaminase family protein [Ruminococcus albus]|uniref:Transglutaminase-like enzyme, putative cysteine protease n=1 Tax=Ruminococcus albus TaxID=1264 RepID=A0A1H7JJA3_RUMAL|nr:transglutaminase family protein [Ruminococcus albus]SEK74602.1 Transglutaminase-like enzyme, putative cysteine protease [Ruminococcus albus]
MKRVNFSYITKLTFDDYVHDHSFALRIIPPETDTQHVISCSLHISPHVSTQQTTDAFGNNVTAGYLKGDHRFLDFEIKGAADIDHSKHRTDYMPCYLYQSQYTKPDEALTNFYESVKSRCTGTVQDRTEFLCDALSDTMEYEKGLTDTSTTSAQAFALKKGVCQDFSHILISLLRMDGIAARYIAGLAFCDGETHSWVEYWTGDHWEGIDPANNCPVSDDYLVISQGRDFRDCSIDRGVMFGRYTRQLQLVRTVLT